MTSNNKNMQNSSENSFDSDIQKAKQHNEQMGSSASFSMNNSTFFSGTSMKNSSESNVDPVIQEARQLQQKNGFFSTKQHE
ncbi:hypothetical protein [Clostridium sp.]|uniref:hypothetical protein n=1 Tax=Clostridium sp. TaxID=1506 RepID=UPI002602D64F|nr:hypothetical protein [Clostridium sp.]